MENSKVSKITLVVFVALCVIDATYGCMCMSSHPQEALCGKNVYTVLVKVRNMEYVYKTEKPKYTPVKANGILKDDADKEAGYGLADVIKNFDEGKQSPKQEMEQIEVVVKDLDHLSQKHFVASHIRYRVKVYETYRGLKPEEVQGKKMYIYTAPDEAMCGIRLRSKEMYLLIGDIHGDRLNIGLCDQVIPWKSLDTKQRRAVRRNMRAAKSTCDSSCEVQSCTWTGCPKPDKDTCMWTSQMERTNAKLNIHPATHACTREPGKQDARCTWTSTLGTNKRGRRRRRHHSTRPESSYLAEKLPILP